MPSVRVRALAKINLDLRVLNKRTDGYHDLRTIFQTVSLADTIEITYRPGRTKIDIKSNLNIENNLIVKAADSILRATRSTGQLGFVLTKRIPLGGGLGGGSSDAAAVLLALPLLLKKHLPAGALMDLASTLGSDVPFFLLGGTAVGLGRGTELYPLPDLPSLPALLVTAGVHVSTADAYRALNRGTASESSSARSAFQQLTWLLGDNWPLQNNFENDFERVVFSQHPQLKSIKGKLLKLEARPALMSGSGSTIFGIFPNRQSRDRAARWFQGEFGSDKIHPVTLISRSRYRALWRRQIEIPLKRKVWLWQPRDRYAE
jgi:4-diphosphocytidyl-2-C-methyl-D-erythritol kinase